jgi:GMP synthase (glutamine-hydrolysing)
VTNVADLTAVEKIIVLDFGSQFNQLITRRIREFGVFSELLSHRTTAEEIRQMAPKGIIFSATDLTVYMMKKPFEWIRKFTN